MEQIITGLLQDFEAGKLTRRQQIQALALGVTARILAWGQAYLNPSEGIPVLEISGHRIPCGQQVVRNSVLGGLHHVYRLEPIAA
jgi:hypothetical protein